MADGPKPPRGQQIITIVAAMIFAVTIYSIVDVDDLDTLAWAGVLILLSSVVAAGVITVLHEAGHAIAGRLVGCEVFAVVIGTGRRHASFRLGSTRVELRGAMLGGSTIANLSGSRWRDLTMLGAGLAVQTVAIAVALLWSPEPLWAQCLKWAIIVVSALTLLTNLWPGRFDLGALPGLPTDGALMREALTDEERWRQTVEQRRLTSSSAAIAIAIQGGDLPAATALAQAHLGDHPDDEAAAKIHGTLLLLDGRWREAHERLVGLDATDDHEVANNAAWAAVMTFDEGLLDAADRSSALALELRPDEPACLSTRGSTLILSGRAGEGLPLLERAVKKPLSNSQKASVLAFTALGEAGLGRLERAHDLLAKAEALHAANPAIPPIRQRIVFAPPDPAARHI